MWIPGTKPFGYQGITIQGNDQKKKKYSLRPTLQTSMSAVASGDVSGFELRLTSARLIVFLALLSWQLNSP